MYGLPVAADIWQDGDTTSYEMHALTDTRYIYGDRVSRMYFFTAYHSILRLYLVGMCHRSIASSVDNVIALSN